MFPPPCPSPNGTEHTKGRDTAVHLVRYTRHQIDTSTHSCAPGRPFRLSLSAACTLCLRTSTAAYSMPRRRAGVRHAPAWRHLEGGCHAPRGNAACIVRHTYLGTFKDLNRLLSSVRIAKYKAQARHTSTFKFRLVCVHFNP